MGFYQHWNPSMHQVGPDPLYQWEGGEDSAAGVLAIICEEARGGWVHCTTNYRKEE